MDAQVPVRRLGRQLVGIAGQVGGKAQLLVAVSRRMVRGDLDGREFWRSFYRMGYRSAGLIAATSVVVGIILVIQAYAFVERYGLRSQLGWGSGFVIIRELGPVLFALMFSGRVGAYTTAELGTMKVTEQLDGLRCLAIDPLSYLVVPRVLSMILSLTVLTIIGNTLAVVTSALVGEALMEVSQHSFWYGFIEVLGPKDFLIGVFKAAAFGAIIAVTSCYYGLSTTGGAPGVGRAVNSSVVASAISIFVVDFLSTFVLG